MSQLSMEDLQRMKLEKEIEVSSASLIRMEAEVIKMHAEADKARKEAKWFPFVQLVSGAGFVGLVTLLVFILSHIWPMPKF
ncbi:hypothetical protein JX85_23700 [Salmonella enterica]|nr:hypothetical protein [Salmonella enterica]EIK4671360.1 hypothetical protein [Salmonella enterica]